VTSIHLVWFDQILTSAYHSNDSSRQQVIGQRWQELTPEQVEYYKKKAEEDMKRYKDQMEEYLAKQDDGKRKKDSDDEGDDDDDDDDGPAKKLKSDS